MKSRFKKKVRYKIIAILQTVLQLWVPVCLLYWSVAQPLPAYADAFLDKAAQGQTFGQSLIPDASTLADQDESGNINLHYQGKTATVAPNAAISRLEEHL